MGDNAGIMMDALTWAGTYHGIGARLPREYAEQIGLDPAFTIHDLEDSADLMNLVRHEQGFSKTKSRFPTKGTCLSIFSQSQGFACHRAKGLRHQVRRATSANDFIEGQRLVVPLVPVRSAFQLETGDPRTRPD